MTVEINFHSSEWLFVFNKSKKEIEECVIELCNVGVSHERSIYLRGKIESLRALIASDKDRFKELSLNPFK